MPNVLAITLFGAPRVTVVGRPVERQSPIPLISIVEETAIVAAAQGFRTVGLLGARFTMERGFYSDVFARHGIRVIVPEKDDRDYVHDRYFSELVEGSFRDETREGMVAIIDRMQATDGIQAVILGGTELPLLFRGNSQSAVPMLDTTAIHVESAITRLLS